MTTTHLSSTLSRRERSVLLAIHAGRCEVSGTTIAELIIDGYGCSDQFIGPRLVHAGLVEPPGPRPAQAQLTATGRAVLEAA